MPQLTGLQTGTAQSDFFVGDLEIVDLSVSATEAGILNATISALGGADTIQGSVSLVPAVTGLTLSATGLSQSVVGAGAGDDTVLGTGVGSGFFEGFNIRGPRYSGTGIGYGLFNGSISGGSGQDTLNFSGTGKNGRTLVGVGISSSRVDGGSGADSITLTGLASGSSDNGVSGTATGVTQSTVSGGAQQDVIAITATAGVSGFSGNSPAVVKGVEQSSISGDGDDDRIAIAATGRGTSSTVSAILKSQVKGGDGNDTLSLTSLSNESITRNFSTTTLVSSAAADDNSLVHGGAGNDVIVLSAEASGANSNTYGASDSQVKGGEGADTITLTAKSSSFGTATIFGAFNAQVDGGAGNDVIELSVSTNSQRAIAAGANQSTIKGGSGDDSIVFKLSGITRSSVGSAGILNSKVYGDAGNDAIRVEAAAPFADFDMVDSLIFGGDGDDTFDVGIGKGTIQGDAGNDTAILNYFNAETMDVVAIAGGIQISGSQTKSGTAGEWSQNILGTERFQVAETVYTAADLVAAFGG